MVDPGQVQGDRAEEKLGLEIQQLRYENSLRGRVFSAILPSAISLITAIVAIVSIVISIAAYRQQSAHTQLDDQDKMIQEALAMATDPAGGPERRISGIYQLSQFWTVDRAVSTVAPTLTAILALPLKPGPDAGHADVPSSLARCAAAAAIEAAFRSNISDVAKRRIALVLFGSASKQVRGLIPSQNTAFYEGFRLTTTGLPQREDLRPTSNEIFENQNCATPVAATRAATEKSADYLADANLEETDLRAINLARLDLRGVSFRRSDILFANFRCSNLAGADFSGAYVRDEHSNASMFELTNLHGAKGLDAKVVKGPTLDLTDEQWEEWKKGGFEGAILERLLKKSVPDNVKEQLKGICFYQPPLN